MTLKKPPLKSEKEDLIFKHVELVHNNLVKISIEKIDEVLKKLTDKEASILLDYLNKSFQLISDGKAGNLKLQSIYLFKLHNKLI